MKITEDGFVNRNKKIILIAVAIMLVSALAGAGIAYLNANGKYNTISDALSSQPVKNDTDDMKISAVDLFIHNFTADLFTVIGGVFFSIISVILVIFNGISIGILFGIDFPYAMVSILPHGVIEYFAGALALAIAFKITLLEIKIIKNRNIKNTLKEHNTDLRDMMTILIVMIVLLGIAAIIEAHITPMIVTGYFGL
ncbi:stage II sporulation protein M [uncultured Methanobrevibacter sp.]|uniref:stage II sporulation protein M n=1 Tax=uncultured Methanobrevibacter sp. TaxID=253161 RepID=UPI00263549F3|nr:stage II sporulation protein M [uncultured Methanobrevibacter sp.]